jgi:hypothetical protein
VHANTIDRRTAKHRQSQGAVLAVVLFVGLTMDYEILPELENALPEQQEDEQQEMLESFRKYGFIKERVVVGVLNSDGKRYLIDGHHIMTICANKAIEPPTPAILHFDTVNEMIELAFTLNLARRNLSATQKSWTRQQRLKITEKLMAEGKTVREIAETTGVSKSQAHNDAKEIEKQHSCPPGGQNDHQKNVPDTKGFASSAPMGTKRDVKSSWCDSCQRIGVQTRHCQACADKAKAWHKAREPHGKGSHPCKGPKPSINGQPMFELQRFIDDVHRTWAYLDVASREFGQLDGYDKVLHDEYRDSIEEAMRKYVRLVTEWHERISTSTTRHL